MLTDQRFDDDFSLLIGFGAFVGDHNQLLIVVVDYDLIENEQLLANAVFDSLKTQYFSVGAEFNAFDFAQLLVGARKNVQVALLITRKIRCIQQELASG